MRYRVTHRSAAARPGLTQVLGASQMKVVVQNGSNHCLSRSEVETMTSLFPKSWDSVVKQLVLGQGPTLTTSFHKKERLLWLYCPPPPSDARNKTLLLTCLLQGLSRAVGHDLPDGLETKCVSCLKSGA